MHRSHLHDNGHCLVMIAVAYHSLHSSISAVPCGPNTSHMEPEDKFFPQQLVHTLVGNQLKDDADGY